MPAPRDARRVWRVRRRIRLHGRAGAVSLRAAGSCVARAPAHAPADVVFTGGYQLYRVEGEASRRTCTSSDAASMRRTSVSRVTRTRRCRPSCAASPQPVLGYFGVVDERLDYELLARLADAFPARLGRLRRPVREGGSSRAAAAVEHPLAWPAAVRRSAAYVKGFDVCLMPFALNEATEFINPTKTLEYMAAGKPIVSTAVPDVVRNFTPIVRVADRPTSSWTPSRTRSSGSRAHGGWHCAGP